MSLPKVDAETFHSEMCLSILTENHFQMKNKLAPISVCLILFWVLIPFHSFATKHIVTVQSFSFNPANISSVLVGDTIRWVWVNGSHTTTSVTIPGGAATWNSPITSVVTSFEYKVTVAGIYNYKCTPHAATMNGSFTASVPINKTLNLTVFLEGLYNGSTMNKAQNATGNQYAGTIADQLTIELHNANPPYSIAGSPFNTNLNTNGLASLTIPASFGSNYYLVVKHRNSVETWSGLPVSFSGTIVSYDFSLASSQAYGNNLKLINGKYLIFACDVNQDGIVDSDDMVAVSNDASGFATGYLSTDANGDGVIDSGDMISLDNNAALLAGKIVP